MCMFLMLLLSCLFLMLLLSCIVLVSFSCFFHLFLSVQELAMAEMMRRLSVDKNFVHLHGWIPYDMTATVQNRLQEVMVGGCCCLSSSVLFSCRALHLFDTIDFLSLRVCSCSYICCSRLASLNGMNMQNWNVLHEFTFMSWSPLVKPSVASKKRHVICGLCHVFVFVGICIALLALSIHNHFALAHLLLYFFF